MAIEITDLEIQIPADEPVEPVSADVTIADAPAKPKGSKPKETPKILEPEVGLEKLKQQLADEQRDKAAALARAKSAETDAATARASETAARAESADSRLHLVTTAIASVTQSLDVGERDYAQALADGDHARAAKINREMGRSQARLEQLETAKQNIESAPKVQPRAAPVDPVEKLAANMTAPSAAWVRAHPQYARDARLYQKMVGAHQLAIGDGLEADSPEYFESIENTLKLRTPAVSATDVDTAPQLATGGRSSAPAAAPVSRSGSGNGSTRPRTMTLTREMREIAQAMGMSDQDYAKYRQQLIDEGQIH